MNTIIANEVDLQKAADDQREAERLLEGIQNGDRKAFQALYDKYRGLVFATVIQVLHSPEDTEDTTQDIFTQFWSRSGLYNSQKGRFSSWLTTLAKNRAIDRIRSRDRRSKLNQGFQAETLMEKGWQAPLPSEETSMREMGLQARSAVMQLSDEQREAITMAYFDGLTQQEISTRTGTPLGTVKARIRRGLGRLRDLIEE
jgi:RNA polymerase sigma-70 factor (ECF subfamily)